MESLNDQRMLRPVDHRCYPAPEQLGLDSARAALSLELPPGLQQLLGKITLAITQIHAVLCQVRGCFHKYVFNILCL